MLLQFTNDCYTSESSKALGLFHMTPLRLCLMHQSVVGSHFFKKHRKRTTISFLYHLRKNHHMHISENLFQRKLPSFFFFFISLLSTLLHWEFSCYIDFITAIKDSIDFPLHYNENYFRAQS